MKQLCNFDCLMLKIQVLKSLRLPIQLSSIFKNNLKVKEGGGHVPQRFIAIDATATNL